MPVSHAKGSSKVDSATKTPRVDISPRGHGVGLKTTNLEETEATKEHAQESRALMSVSLVQLENSTEATKEHDMSSSLVSDLAFLLSAKKASAKIWDQLQATLVMKEPVAKRKIQEALDDDDLCKSIGSCRITYNLEEKVHDMAVSFLQALETPSKRLNTVGLPHLFTKPPTSTTIKS